MKKIVLSALAAMSLFSLAWAAETMWIQRADNITMGLPLELADSVALSSDGKSVIFQANNAVSQTLSNSNIVKVTMGDAQNVVSVKYSGTDAAIVNPYAFEGVSVEKNGGDVIIRSTSSEELTYDLSGTTTSGSFKIYSVVFSPCISACFFSFCACCFFAHSSGLYFISKMSITSAPNMACI